MIHEGKSLSFPVLCLPRHLGVAIARGWPELERCRAVVFWRARFYDHLRLVDADGEAHEVTKAVVCRPESRLGQRLARFLDLSVSVKIETKHIGPASLSEIVEVVEKAMADDPEAFEELSGYRIPWWKSLLAQCSTVREVVQALSRRTNDA